MIRTLLYSNGNVYEAREIENIKEILNNNNLLWVDLQSPDENEIKILSDVFNFHPLAVEDCVNRVQRPKVDNYKDYYFMVLYAYSGKDTQRHFTYTGAYIFMGRNYLITVSWEKISIINEIYKRMMNAPELFMRGIDFLLYSLFDAIIDDYFPLTDKIGDKIDKIEEIILRNPKKQIQDEILSLKRTILKLRRILSPQREVLNILLRHDFTLIKDENRLYFMDVYDHILRITDLMDTYQDLLAGTLELYMSQISNRMNEVMKVLTIITTIMMPLTLITGVYGMNFKYMPELDMRYGYYMALGLMGIIVFIEIIFFKIKKWL